MKTNYDLEARKRPVNLTLNEDLVKQVKTMTDNLSGVVESLLADYVARERQEQTAKSTMLKSTVATWNEFNARVGSISDEYSSL